MIGFLTTFLYLEITRGMNDDDYDLLLLIRLDSDSSCIMCDWRSGEARQRHSEYLSSLWWQVRLRERMAGCRRGRRFELPWLSRIAP